MKYEEARLQEACVRAFRLMFPNEHWRLHMNHNNPKSKRHGGMLVSQGLLKGVSDLEFIDINGSVHFIELKTPKGRLSKSQREFKAKIDEAPSVVYKVIRSPQEFIDYIKLLLR